MPLQTIILYFSEKIARDNKQLAADQGTIRGTVWWVHDAGMRYIIQLSAQTNDMVHLMPVTRPWMHPWPD